MISSAYLTPLALVGFGRAVCPDFSGHLADLLLVGTADHDAGQFRTLNIDPRGNRIFHVMTVPKLKDQILALDLRAIADAVDLEGLRKALGNAGDEVLYDRAGRTPHLARTHGVVTGLHPDLVVLFADLHVIGKGGAQFAQLALGGHPRCRRWQW